MTRNLAETEGMRHQTAINLQLTRMAIMFRADVEREIQRAFSQGGFTAADQATAYTSALTAIKAVFT